MNFPNFVERGLPTGTPHELYIIGSCGYEEVVLKSTLDGSIYVTNLGNNPSYNHHVTRKVVPHCFAPSLYRCTFTPGENGKIVCGTGDSQIVIFNRDWSVEDIVRVTSDKSRDANILVAGTANGVVLFAPYGSCDIFELDLATKIIRKLTYHRQLDFSVHELHLLSSGKIAVFSKDSASHGNRCLHILDNSCNPRTLVEFPDRDAMGLATDRSRDFVYVLYRDQHHDDVTVDVMSSAGALLAKRVVSMKMVVYYPTFAILRPFKIVVYNDASRELSIFEGTPGTKNNPTPSPTTTESKNNPTTSSTTISATTIPTSLG